MAENFNRQRKTEIMHALAKDGGWRCHYCHIPLVPRGQEGVFCTITYSFDEDGRGSVKSYTLPAGYSWPSLDHKKPQMYGVDHDQENLVLACIPCNSRKAARFTYEEFYEMTAAFREKRARGGEL